MLAIPCYVIVRLHIMAVPYCDLWEFVPLVWTTGYNIDHLHPGEGQFWYPSFDNAQSDDISESEDADFLPLHAAA